MSNQLNAAVAPQALPPEIQLAQLFMGPFIAQAIYVCAKLAIADLLKEGPVSMADLAIQTGAHERSLYRALRCAASVGVFAETEGKTFVNTPMSELLITDAPNSMRYVTMWMGEEEHWRVYGHLLHSVKTGETAWEVVHGEPVFKSLFETMPALGDIFNKAMTSFSHQVVPEVNRAYDFSGVARIADIAGGHGHILGGILKENPGIEGVLFDLPPVLAGAGELLGGLGVADRVELREGNFFEEVPVEADLYILKYILHDWDDDECVTILSNIRKVIPQGGKVVLLEAVVPEGNTPDFSKIIDMEMMLSPGGIERTETEYAELFERSGFKLNRIIPLNSPVSIIEAVTA
jgi:hypothetical protein